MSARRIVGALLALMDATIAGAYADRGSVALAALFAAGAVCVLWTARK